MPSRAVSLQIVHISINITGTAYSQIFVNHNFPIVQSQSCSQFSPVCTRASVPGCSAAPLGASVRTQTRVRTSRLRACIRALMTDGDGSAAVQHSSDSGVPGACSSISSHQHPRSRVYVRDGRRSTPHRTLPISRLSFPSHARNGCPVVWTWRLARVET